MQNFKDQESKILDWWDSQQTFELSVKKEAPKGDYLFYDGPPFATGEPHYGHLVASIMKDAVPRYWTMNGFRVERVWGWDCHGLPIENIVEKELGSKTKKEIEALGIDKFNEMCRSKVLSYVDVWERVVRRIGRWVDMKNAYRTMDLPFMESVWWVFKQLWDRDLIYQDYRSLHICPRCETTLSQSEVAEGYKDIKDLSLTAKFELADEPGTFILAWTTTPWTLIGNVALAVGKEIEYSLVKLADEQIILASELVDKILAGREFSLIKKFKGSDLVGKAYQPLFDYYANDEKLANRQNGWKIYAADFVTTEDGTGVVHIAPAFGEDDMNLGKANNLPFVQHVGMDGLIKPEAKELAGLHVKPKDDVQSTDVAIIKYLANKNLLFSKEQYEHSYPHCWRCDTPLINYSTTSWFVGVTKIKEQAINLAKEINWSPEHIKEGRFGKWLEGARDWSISRQRFWASVMPIWVCDHCQEKRVFGSVKDLEQASGKTVNDLHKHIVDQITFPCAKCSGTMKRIPDVLDTWFDSGSMPYAQFHYDFENKEKFESSFPAKFIAEGADQTRCWFYYLHVIATAIKNSPAYKNVIVNGIVLAEDGKKMSKKLKNYPEPTAIIEKYGADALRLYLLNSPVMLAENLSFVEKDLQTVYRRFTTLLQNVCNFYEMFKGDYSADGDNLSELNNILDQWIVSKYYVLLREVTEAMESYNLVKATRPLLDFVDDLSTWYLRRSRDRFKSEDNKDAEAAVKTLAFILKQFSKVIAPFTPMTAEIIYQMFSPEESVHLQVWPEVKKELVNLEVIKMMDAVKQIVEAAHGLRAQGNLKVRQPLATLEVNSAAGLAGQENYLNILADELNVEQVKVVDNLSAGDNWLTAPVNNFNIALNKELTEDLQDKGIVRELIRLINNLRKEAGLIPTDRPTELYSTNSQYLLSVINKYHEEIAKGTSAGSLEQAENITDGKIFQINEENITLGLK